MPSDNVFAVPPAVRDRLNLAELAKYLISGGSLNITHPDGSHKERLVFAFAGQPLPLIDPDHWVSANQTGLFVSNALNNPPCWLGIGSLDELPTTLEAFNVGASFLERFVRLPEFGKVLYGATNFQLKYGGEHSVRLVGRAGDEETFDADKFIEHFAAKDGDDDERPKD